MSKIPIKTRDILGPNVLVALQSLLFPRLICKDFFLTNLASFRRKNCFEPHLKNHTRLATLPHRLATLLCVN